jgi:Tol biopolymer transport system component
MLISKTGSYFLWSPDGRYIAFTSDNDGTFEELDIYLLDASCIDRPEECGSSLVRLTKDQGWNWFADWSLDGEQILFASDREDSWEVHVMDDDGRNVTGLTDSGGGSSWPAGWLADGEHIVFSSDRDGDEEIYVMDDDGSNVVKLTDNSADDTAPALWP